MFQRILRSIIAFVCEKSRGKKVRIIFSAYFAKCRKKLPSRVGSAKPYIIMTAWKKYFERENIEKKEKEIDF